MTGSFSGSNMAGIDYRNIGIGNLDEVKEFILVNHSLREPMAAHLGISKDLYWKSWGPEIKSALKHDASIGVFEKSTGKLCGIQICSLGELYLTPRLLDETNELRIRQYELFDSCCMDGVKEALDTKKYLNIDATCVDEAYGKQGIAIELFKRTEQTAMKYSSVYLTVCCSSIYTYKIAKKLGYETRSKIIYKSYVDPLTGRMIFSNMQEPYKECVFMVKKASLEASNQ